MLTFRSELHKLAPTHQQLNISWIYEKNRKLEKENIEKEDRQKVRDRTYGLPAFKLSEGDMEPDEARGAKNWEYRRSR